MGSPLTISRGWMELLTLCQAPIIRLMHLPFPGGILSFLYQLWLPVHAVVLGIFGIYEKTPLHNFVLSKPFTSRRCMSIPFERKLQNICKKSHRRCIQCSVPYGNLTGVFMKTY